MTETHTHTHVCVQCAVLLLLPEDIKVSPKIRPNAAASKCAYDTLYETVARSSLVSSFFVRCLVGSCCLVHSYAVALKQSCTQTPTHPHSPRTHTHTPAAITSVAQTKPARSITRCHWVCLGWAGLEASSAPSPTSVQVRAPAKGHRACWERCSSCAALSSSGSHSARSWLPSCDSVSCVRFTGQKGATRSAPAPSTTATTTTTTTTSQVLTVCFSFSYSYSE